MTRTENPLVIEGLVKCFKAYMKNCPKEHIFEVGFDSDTGYVYIALESNNVQICSVTKSSVAFVATDIDEGNESYFDTYKEALAYLEK